MTEENTDVDRPEAAAQPESAARAGRSGLSRRGMLGLAGAAVGAGVVGFGAGAAVGHAVASSPTDATYPFYGANQAGITTPAQDRLHFAAFDVAAGLDRGVSSSCCAIGPSPPRG